MPKPKKIVQRSLDGDTINVYESQTHAATTTGVSCYYIRRSILSGGITPEGGFLWSYLESDSQRATTHKEYDGVGVSQYTMDGEFVKTFPSASAAAREIGCNSGRILDAARNKKKSVHGFLWRRYMVKHLSNEDLAISQQYAAQRQ